ncbi:LacI family transcriptional regulator [Candidatus Aerophobetes bacterium Ae_b3a]|nr:MAG: LacI family transcriptional regulator [Candidatus Aerophobetes bacterium Ae_b3a]
MTTIYDVAASAGVSPSTVSLVISGSSKIRKSTRNRVLRVMEELRFRPNIVARSLRSKKTHTCGLLIETITNPFFTEVALGVEKRARSEGFNVILCNTESNARLEREYIETLLSKQIDGLILCALKDPSYLKTRLGSRYPLVVINERMTDLGFDFVGIDNLGAVVKAVDHLIKQGHRRIGLVADELVTLGCKERHSGYKKALLAAGLDYCEELVQKRPTISYQEGLEATRLLLELRHPPTAIFCISDMMALGAIDGCKKQGLSVPEDMAIIGFDDVWFSASESIQLTTIRQPQYQMGIEAVNLFLERASGKRKESKQVILPTDLVIRRTCGAKRMP